MGNEIHLVYQQADPNPDSIKRDYLRTVQQIKTYLNWLSGNASQFNNELEPLLRGLITERKKRLLAGAGMVESLGLPIKRREDLPTTFAVPIVVRPGENVAIVLKLAVGSVVTTTGAVTFMVNYDAVWE